MSDTSPPATQARALLDRPPARSRLAATEARPTVSGAAVSQATAEELTLLTKTQEFVQREFSRLLVVFYSFNGVVIFMVVALSAMDFWFMTARPPGTPYQRLITERVIMALIAASAAQLGALAFSVGKQVLRLQNSTLALVAATRKRGKKRRKSQDDA
jgi:hypothetical protein